MTSMILCMARFLCVIYANVCVNVTPERCPCLLNRIGDVIRSKGSSCQYTGQKGKEKSQGKTTGRSKVMGNNYCVFLFSTTIDSFVHGGKKQPFCTQHSCTHCQLRMNMLQTSWLTVVTSCFSRRLASLQKRRELRAAGIE